MLIGLVVLFAYLVQDVSGVAVKLDSPTEVVVGETFDLRVIVRNERTGENLELADIDIADEYLAGFTITSVSPEAKSSTHVPFDNSQSYTFDASIPPGESRDFVFTLRAESPGIYRGDVDVCEGALFISQIAETVVREQDE